jgi:hypothetical protein
VAAFTLASGEQLILDEAVTAVDERVQVRGRVIVTDRRVVLVRAGRPKWWWFALGWFGWLRVFIGATAQQVAAEIDREDFDAVGPDDHDRIYFRNRGTGYAHRSFSILSKTALAVWQQRMHAWASGTALDGGLPSSLPVATIARR